MRKRSALKIGTPKEVQCQKQNETKKHNIKKSHKEKILCENMWEMLDRKRKPSLLNYKLIAHLYYKRIKWERKVVVLLIGRGAKVAIVVIF